MEAKAFQDLIPDNHCFGCGPHNEWGLRVKSRWLEQDRSICNFKPAAHHCAGPAGYLNGGIIATLIDCHCVCTTIAMGYQLAGRAIGEGERIWYVTGTMEIAYKRPVSIQSEVVLLADIVDISEKKITLGCTLLAEDAEHAHGKVVAVKVPPDWPSCGH